jgi:hypothetical protein
VSAVVGVMKVTRRWRGGRGVRPRRQPLVALVSRLVLAQSGATGAIALTYLRRNVTWLLFAAMLTAALCLLAGLVRSGTHAAWVAAVACESAISALGLARVLTGAGYLGGTLLGIGALGVLLHPSTGRAFAPAAGPGQPEMHLGEATHPAGGGGR